MLPYFTGSSLSDSERPSLAAAQAAGKQSQPVPLRQAPLLTVDACPLLESGAAGREHQLGEVLPGEETRPLVLAHVGQPGSLHQVVELLVHILGATDQLQVLAGLQQTRHMQSVNALQPLW